MRRMLNEHESVFVTRTESCMSDIKFILGVLEVPIQNEVELTKHMNSSQHNMMNNGITASEREMIKSHLASIGEIDIYDEILKIALNAKNKNKL